MPQTRLQAGCSKQALTHHPDDDGNNRLAGNACTVHGTILTDKSDNVRTCGDAELLSFTIATTHRGMSPCGSC